MLELVGVRHRYDGRIVLDLERFAVASGAAVAIVGPNGSGKSTLLRLLALLERPSEGEVRLDGAVASASPALRRRVTLVEQRPVLFRGTVRENLEYGLRARGIRRTKTIENVAERFALAPLLERRRHELSDGEVQRVAVARALAVEPEVLLLDEPVSSADRAAAQTLYRALAEERARPDGRLSPITPENLFRVDVPREAFGAGGSDLKHVCVGAIEIVVATEKAGPAILAVAPTDIFVSREPLASSARNVFTGRVIRLTHHRGGVVHVTADVGAELVAVVTEEAARDLALTPGGPVVFSFKASAVRVF